MKECRPTDLYKVLKESTYSIDDDAYLIDFYAPIVSLKTIMIYLALRNQTGEGEIEFSSFYSLFQITEGEFVNALESLEALALIKTFLLKKTSNNYFTFALYSPRNPQEFFSNVLLIGTLKKFTNEEYISSLEKKYALESLPEGHQDVTTKFQDYFSFDFNGENFNTLSSNLLSKKTSVISLYFDKKKFISKMIEEIPNFKETSLSKTEYVKVARYAALYNYDEETMASFLSSSINVYNPNKKYGESINFKALETICLDNDKTEYMHKKIAPLDSEVHGDAPIAQTIRAMDRLSSIEFLSKLQNGGKPATSDLKLINTLSTDMGLPDNVINALIFYVLKMKNNVLNNTYVEKLAGSLAREGCQTALDAFNYLENTSSGMKNSKKQTKKPIKPIEIKPIESHQEETKNTDESVDDDDYEEFLNSL